MLTGEANKMETNEWVTGEVVLRVAGEPLKMQMTVPATPVKPHRMLPVFQKMTDAFVEMGALAAGAQGKTISCRAGCGACCRQPVPLTEMEVYSIAELVESMPEPRRTEIKKRFSDAVEHFRQMGWFDRIKKLQEGKTNESRDVVIKKLQKEALKYFYEGIPCPFLEEESCSIHENRPLICREFLVTSPAVNCSAPTPKNISRVELLVKPSGILRHVGETGRFFGVIPMIQALEFAEKYPENFEERTGERWAADFFGKLTHNYIPAPDMSIASEKPAKNKAKSRNQKRK